MQRPLSVVRTALLLAAGLLIPGCFSMSGVAPPPGLPPYHFDGAPLAATFDPATPPEVESIWGASFVLVHPLVNGQDVGWFIFDTGASGWTITRKAAERAGLVPFAWTNIQGTTPSTVYAGESVRLGPMTLHEPRLTGMNMSGSSLVFGREISGIVGKDVCQRAVIEIDAAGSRLALHDPGAFAEPRGATWHEVVTQKHLPHVRCRYANDGDGLFVLDSGCDGCVHFFGRAVEAHDLLAAGTTGRKTQITFGARQTIHTGTVERFAIGEQQFGPVEATFAGEVDPASGTLPGTDGMIGMRFLKRFVVYLDLPRSRVAFMPGER